MSGTNQIELGLTIPLQRHLRAKALPYGREPDRRFCWDLHVISLRVRSSLLAVHCHSRYAFALGLHNSYNPYACPLSQSRFQVFDSFFNHSFPLRMMARYVHSSW